MQCQVFINYKAYIIGLQPGLIFQAATRTGLNYFGRNWAEIEESKAGLKTL
jgi:hypothetical protein